MDVKTVCQSKGARLTLAVVGMLFLGLACFAAGVAVGLHKARFSYAWGQNYERNFIGERLDRSGWPMLPRDLEGRDFRNPHGVAGTLLSLPGNDTLVVKDREGKENTVQVTDKTALRRGSQAITLQDLQVGESVVVIGKPSGNGTVTADLIRAFGGAPVSNQ